MKHRWNEAIMDGVAPDQRDSLSRHRDSGAPGRNHRTKGGGNDVLKTRTVVDCPDRKDTKGSHCPVTCALLRHADFRCAVCAARFRSVDDLTPLPRGLPELQCPTQIPKRHVL